MSEFDVYDVRKQNKVFAMEPFTVLAMLCESTFAEQIQFCFELFDFNSNNRLSKDELTILVSTLLNGLHRANVSVAPKTEEQEEKLAESVAEGILATLDTDHDNEVTAADLLQWAENSEQLSNLLKGFANGNPQKQIAAMVGPAKRGHRTLDPRRSKDIHKRALRRYGSDVARKKREKEIDNYIKKRTLGGNLSKIKYHERREQFKQAHGRVSAVASNKVLLKLIDETRMEYKDLLSLREEFASAIGARPENGYISIDYKTLKGCLISKFPHLEDGSVLDHIVHVFDVDGNQKIDFSEFACGLSKLLLGSVPEQLSFMFSMFDQDGDGSIQLWEVVELVEEAFEVWINDTFSIAQKLPEYAQFQHRCRYSFSCAWCPPGGSL